MFSLCLDPQNKFTVTFFLLSTKEKGILGREDNDSSTSAKLRASGAAAAAGRKEDVAAGTTTLGDNGGRRKGEAQSLCWDPLATGDSK